MKYPKRIIACLICCLLMLSLVVPVGATGTESGAQTESCELVIRYFYQDTPVTGAQFHIYRVGDANQYSELYLDGDFADYPVDMSTEDLAALAETLYGYAMMDALTPTYQVQIDQAGEARVADMTRGLYLVVGQRHETDTNVFLTEPQLVILPAVDADGKWTSSVTLHPKGSVEIKPVTIKVLKQWEDAGCESYRPSSIEVSLLRDGEVYDTVTLSAENNWRHTWESLPGGSLWTVVEDVPEHYTVRYTQAGITYLITNTCDAPPPPTEPPENPPELPQTGMLWWPVPVMLAAGLLLVFLGLLERRNLRHEK